jgi:acyl carrier protein
MPRTSQKRAPGSRPAVDAGLPANLVDALIDTMGVDEEAITRDSLLADDLGMDSLDLVELCIDLEERYEGKLTEQIDDETAEGWQTVGDVYGFLKGKGLEA